MLSQHTAAILSVHSVAKPAYALHHEGQAESDTMQSNKEWSDLREVYTPAL